MNRATKFSIIACAAIALSPLSYANTTYSTVTSWNGSNSISTFGGGVTPTYGETFIAPTTDTVLQDFTFYIDSSGTVNVNAQVFAWSGSLTGGAGSQGATGSALFSTPFTINAAPGFQAETITTGGVNLVAGQAYVILFNDPTNSGAGTTWGRVNTHVAGAGGGGFNFANNEPVNSGLWDDFADFGDLAFTADFTGPAPVPEPGSLALLGTGLLGTLGMVRRRFRA